MEPSVNIVMTTYNAAEFLSEQLESILGQQYSRWTLLISDDGSTDGTLDIIHDYHDRYIGQIVNVTPPEPFHDVSCNVEYLLSQTTAPYVMVADHDDVWLSQKVGLTMNAMIKAEGDCPQIPCLVHTDLEVVDAQLTQMDSSYWHYSHLKPTQRLPELLFQNVVTGCTMMINRSLLDKAMPFPSGIFMYDWWMGLVAATFGSLVPVPQATIRYRQHGTNMVGAQKVQLQPAQHRLTTLWTTWQVLQQTMVRRLDRTQRQAEVFLNQYAPQLDDPSIRMLNEYVALRHHSCLQRRRIGMQYGFFGNSWQTLIGMWLLL